MAYAQIARTAEGRTLDELKNLLSERLQAEHKVKGPIEWRAAGNNPPRVVSQATEVETPDKVSGRKRTQLVRWALVKLDDRKLVLVNFTLPPEASRGSSTYVTLVDRIVESIRPAPCRPG